ncbi:MAG TPA: DUF2071 domain-containing protein [Ktedonobacterales bacterium]
MKPDEILRQTGRRPWPLPEGPWVMRQTWDRLLFAHWPVPFGTLRPLIPASLELDRYEGEAWLGVVPFLMRNVRPRALPAVPWLSAFPELNVRTYVTVGGKAGVYFFSLDAGNPLAVAIARRWFHLPYFRARFAVSQAGETTTYHSMRTHSGAPAAELDVTYRPTGPVYASAPGSLDAFLTERYCLYTTDARGQLLRGEIHHQEWPLQPAEAEFRRNTMALAASLALPDIPPLLHYTRHLETLTWPLARV